MIDLLFQTALSNVGISLALVLSSLNPKPHTYADSLLNAIKYLASPVIRPPAMCWPMP